MNNINDLGQASGTNRDLSDATTGLERKFARFGEAIEVDADTTEGMQISGYASLFGDVDQGGDVVQRGAYGASLKAVADAGRSIKMLWQHDPAQPIGIWDEVREDDKGLWVKGRILSQVEKGREAAALIGAGAIDGLSIGYRTIKATKNDKGQRLLSELELWEVSLVTFPMLPSARVGSKSDVVAIGDVLREMAAAFEGARAEMARG
ncbi:HK97 family phage prohead protease [Sulfitobacter aestuariivivens]|uniref:HK97 family phage prohead protease n=1 Tax=Sulfitobacter aestuariivivens TaxID=2766981 RepID=A0A927D3Y3_9RHOB|nr:HK97 family phage prohead protease [Sulfitobacter aestuariivivens]MBD3662927.1 HK97 family phage prohead protease [Sulfitobacter aestuariivivens]